MRTMKKYIDLGVVFIVMVSFLGCATTTPKRSDTLVNDYGYYQIYKKDRHFYVIQNGSVVYEKLKYVNPRADKIYALDKHNKKQILKVKYKELKQEKLPLLQCGNGEYLHTFSIEEKGSSLDIMVNVVLTYSEENIIENKKIVSIPKTKVDRVYFSDNTVELETSGENVSNYYLYFQKGSQYGFLGKINLYYEDEKFIHTFTKDGNTVLYDELHIVDGMDGHFLLKKDGLSGYYFRAEQRMIALKYTSLSLFDFGEYGLARFELPDGRKGYVDTEGNEYCDEI